MNISRHTLRRRFRRRRNELSRAVARKNAEAVARHLARSGLLHAHRTIAAYLARDGELDPTPFVDRAFCAGKMIVLPALGRDRRLHFRRFVPGAAMARNRFGIPEPAPAGRSRPPIGIGVVLVPLVAFDDTGQRLGMGGGFYDATFGRLARRPLLAGLAHACQHSEPLPRRSWDVPLDMVVTEDGITTFTTRARRYGETI